VSAVIDPFEPRAAQRVVAARDDRHHHGEERAAPRGRGPRERPEHRVDRRPARVDVGHLDPEVAVELDGAVRADHTDGVVGDAQRLARVGDRDDALASAKRDPILELDVRAPRRPLDARGPALGRRGHVDGTPAIDARLTEQQSDQADEAGSGRGNSLAVRARQRRRGGLVTRSIRFISIP